MSERQTIYLGVIRECPDVRKIGTFAYHIPLNEERCNDNFCYGLKNIRSFADNISKLKSSESKADIVNGIPRRITDGLAPEYIFEPLSEDDIRFIFNKVELSSDTLTEVF